MAVKNQDHLKFVYRKRNFKKKIILKYKNGEIVEFDFPVDAREALMQIDPETGNPAYSIPESSEFTKKTSGGDEEPIQLIEETKEAVEEKPDKIITPLKKRGPKPKEVEETEEG
jgi:hypothetical protein